MKIRSIKALEILDSRGEPTIETVVSLADGSTGKAAKMEGFSFVGVEREKEYCEIAKKRIESAARYID